MNYKRWQISNMIRKRSKMIITIIIIKSTFFKVKPSNNEVLIAIYKYEK